MNEPYVGHESACTDADVSNAPTRKFIKHLTDRAGSRDKHESIRMDDGTKTVEYSHRVTIRDVEYAIKELKWNDKECYEHFPQTLEGYASTVWEEVLEEI